MLIKFIIILSLLWAGMILGISFLESWVKFRARTITRPIALDVGRTVFGAFHKVQLVLMILLLGISLWVITSPLLWSLLVLLCLILVIQTFVLLPKLNQRAEQIIAGQEIPKSKVHRVYAVLEFLKLAIVISIATKLLIL